MDDITTIEINCLHDDSCNVQIMSAVPGFMGFPIETMKSELIAKIVCHGIKRLMAMDKQELMNEHLKTCFPGRGQ